MPTPSPIHTRLVTENNELRDSIRFIQVYSRRRYSDPNYVQVQVSTPNLPNPKNKVNAVLEISSQSAHDHNLPIAIRKEERHKRALLRPIVPFSEVCVI